MTNCADQLQWATLIIVVLCMTFYKCLWAWLTHREVMWGKRDAPTQDSEQGGNEDDAA